MFTSIESFKNQGIKGFDFGFPDWNLLIKEYL